MSAEVPLAQWVFVCVKTQKNQKPKSKHLCGKYTTSKTWSCNLYNKLCEDYQFSLNDLKAYSFVVCPAVVEAYSVVKAMLRYL